MKDRVAFDLMLFSDTAKATNLSHPQTDKDMPPLSGHTPEKIV